MLTNPQVRQLKGAGQRLEPMLRLGKEGLTPGFVATIDRALTEHELVKIKFLGFKEERYELSDRIAAETNSEIIMIVGHVAVFFRQHPDPERRKILIDVAPGNAKGPSRPGSAGSPD